MFISFETSVDEAGATHPHGSDQFCYGAAAAYRIVIKDLKALKALIGK